MSFRKFPYAAAIGLGIAGLLGTEWAAAQSASPVTIEFAAWQFTEKGRGEKLNALVDKFMQGHPDIKIEKVAVPYPQFEQTIFTQAGQGAGPDVFVLGDDAFPKAVNAGFFEPLGELMDLPSLNLTSVNEDAVIDGKQYGLVWGANTYNLIYNKELLSSIGAKVPASYDEFLDVAKRLQEKGVFAFAFRTTSAETAGMWYDVSNWVYGAGGRWAKDGQPEFDGPQVVEGVDRLANIYKSGYVPKGADAATYRRMFWEGKVAMFIDNLSLPGIIAAGNPDMRDKIGVARNPFQSGDHASLTTFIGINANSKNKKAAAEFMSYLFSQEGQLALYELLGGVSVGTKLDLSNNPLGGNAPWLGEMEAAIEAQHAVSTVPEGLAQKASELRTVMSEALEQVLFNGTSAQDAMKKAQEQAKAIAAE